MPFRNDVVTGPGGAQVLVGRSRRQPRRAVPARRPLAARPPPMAGEPTRLARRLGLFDAVVIGLGAMIGAGVFAAVGPAADAAGGGLLIGLAIAAAVAFCNATSSAQLAAVYPESGGTYVYGRERLGELWGYLAGWGFVVGKTASCAAMALTFGAYAAPELAAAARRRRGRRADRRELPGRPQDGAGSPASSSPSCWPSLDRRRGRRAVRRRGHRRPTSGRSLAGGWSGHPRVGRAAVLRLRRLRPHRHPRRGGRSTRPARSPGRSRSRSASPSSSTPRSLTAALARGRPRRAGGVAGAARRPRCEAGSLDWLAPAVRVGRHRRLARRAALAHRRRQPHHLRHGRQRRPARAGSAASTPSTGCPTTPSSRSARSSPCVVLVADLRGAIGFSSFAVLAYYAIANAAGVDAAAATSDVAPGAGRRRPGRLRRLGLHPPTGQRRRRLGGPRRRRRRLVRPTGAPALARGVGWGWRDSNVSSSRTTDGPMALETG